MEILALFLLAGSLYVGAVLGLGLAYLFLYFWTPIPDEIYHSHETNTNIGIRLGATKNGPHQ